MGLRCWRPRRWRRCCSNMKRLVVSLLGAALLLGGAGQAPSMAFAAPFVQPVAATTSAAAFGVKAPEARAGERIWPDERIYFLMIDRFHNGDKTNDLGTNPADIRNWHGGDLQGVIDKLDYIKDLGFTTIWITPHVKNTGRDYHGYGAVDFFDTDPHFGTLAKTKEFVQKAHEKGLKVIFDIVVNHTGPQHPLAKEHPDWFHPKSDITNWNDEKQLQEGWIFALPDFDQDKPEVRDYILKYSRFWIEETGVDGFRLDTVKHVGPAFFAWYSAELQKVKPGFWLIGEVWLNTPYKFPVYQQAGVTALLDFPVSETARGVFAKDNSMTTLANMVGQVGKVMDDPYQMGAFLDNHDMARFVSEAKNDPEGRLKLGLTFLFTQRSIPILYAGTEVAMPGANDPYNRVDFPWGKEQGNPLTDFVKTLNKHRAEHIALRRGVTENLLSDRTTYAYARVHASETVVVVLNNHATDAFTAPVDVAALNFAPGTVLQDLLSDRRVTVQGGTITPEVGARSGAIFVPVVTTRGTGLLYGALAAIAGGTGALYLLRRRKTA
jgi:glycosidase